MAAFVDERSEIFSLARTGWKIGSTVDGINKIIK
jgi:hypothetical protein